MLIYYVLLALIFLPVLLIQPRHRARFRKVYVILICAALFAVSACRDIAVGVDTRQFCDAYRRIGVEGLSAFKIERYEPLFTLLCLGLNQISSNYQLLIVVASAICLMPIVRMIYKTAVDIPMAFFLYLTMNLYFSSMNTMRQAMAIGVIALAIPGFIQERKKIPFVVSVLVAFLFHRSALVALLLIPLSEIWFSKRWTRFYVLCACLGFIFSETIVDIAAGLLGLDTFYDEAFMGSNYFGAAITAAVAAVIVVVCIYLFDVGQRIRKTSPYDSILQHALMLWFIFNVMCVQVQIIGRFGDYFSLFVIIALPLAISRLQATERLLVKYVTCVAFLAYFTVVGIARPEWYGAVPYIFDLTNVLDIFV